MQYSNILGARVTFEHKIEGELFSLSWVILQRRLVSAAAPGSEQIADKAVISISSPRDASQCRVDCTAVQWSPG